MRMAILNDQFDATKAQLKTDAQGTRNAVKSLESRVTEEDSKHQVRYQELQGNVQQLESTLLAKESVIQMVTAKLHVATESLRSKEEGHSTAVGEMRERMTKLQSELRLVKADLSRRNQEYVVMGNELKAHKEVLDAFTEKMNAAETGSQNKEEQLTQMQQLLVDMKHDLGEQSAKVSMIEEVEEHEKQELREEVDKLRSLYFQTLCLLAKVQHFNENKTPLSISADDLFEELVTKQKIEVEQWPAEVFGRLPQMASENRQTRSLFAF